jgi:prepilin-type processing-associated H-X9-DG protein
MRGNTAKFVHSSDLALITDANARGGNQWLLYYDNAANVTLGDIYNAPGAGFPGASGFPAGNNSGKACGNGQLFDVSRHRGRINIGCADGHVANIPLRPGDLSNFSLNVDFVAP